MCGYKRSFVTWHTAVCLSFSYHYHWLPDLASLHARAGPHVVYVWFTYVPHTSLSRWDYYLFIDAQCWVNVSLFYTFEFYNLAIHRTSKYFNQNINTYRSVAFIECNPPSRPTKYKLGQGLWRRLGCPAVHPSVHMGGGGISFILHTHILN